MKRSAPFRSSPAMAVLEADAAPLRTRPHRNAQALGRVLVIAFGLLALMPEVALAAPWDNVAQNVLDMFTGGLTRTIAIIAVIGCGIAALAGKLQWSWAINIILGIVLIFGGATFVDYIIAAAA